MKMFRRVSIRFRLLLLTGTLCLFTGAASFLGYYRLGMAEESVQAMYIDRLMPVYWTNDNRNHSRMVEASVYSLMIVSDAAQRSSIAAEIAERREAMDRNLSEHEDTILTPREAELLAESRRALTEAREAINSIVGMTETVRGVEAYAAYGRDAAPAFDRLQNTLLALSDYCLEEAGHQNEETKAAIATARRVLVLLAVASVVSGLLFGLLIASSVAKALAALRSGVERFSEGDLTVEFDESGEDEISLVARSLALMGEKLRRAIKSIADAAEKLGNSSEDFSALAEESNAGVEESRAGVDDVSSQMESLAAASQEINAGVGEVAAGAQSSAQKGTEMANEVERARLSGEEGRKAVEKVVLSIGGVAEDTERSAREVGGLGDRAREIQSFVTQIGAIADQTNLLALNAAIEAARAGEAGRGFAVVAEEVRKLAEESNEAAKQIASLAAGITKDLDSVVASSEKNAKESKRSSALAEETRGTIETMMAALSRISTATQDLAAVSEEQAASSEEIAGAVRDIASRASAASASSDMVRGQMSEVGTSAERVAQGSEELARLSVELRKLVSAFRFDEEARSGSLVPVENPTERGRRRS